MERRRLRSIGQNVALLLGSLAFCLLAVEAGYRVIDPFPYVSLDEVNTTEHGHLSMHDDTLGWKGVPGGRAELVTRNSRIEVRHNAQGFRDVEHEPASDHRPAIAFLGDSYAWGYEVGFDDMFVNRLRTTLPGFELFNLSHRAYGTDQQLLAFTRWSDPRPLRLVVLMVSPNDVDDNRSGMRYDKPKPHYRLAGDRLLLDGIPVPRVAAWAHAPPAEHSRESWPGPKKLLFRSHFLHDVYFRLRLFGSSKAVKPAHGMTTPGDLRLTGRLLQELNNQVEARHARLLVFFIPFKGEIERPRDAVPYQVAIGEECRKLGIECVDLAPHFKGSRNRTYFRYGNHWNARGHRVAAEAVYQYLTRRLGSYRARRGRRGIGNASLPHEGRAAFSRGRASRRRLSCSSLLSCDLGFLRAPSNECFRASTLGTPLRHPRFTSGRGAATSGA